MTVYYSAAHPSWTAVRRPDDFGWGYAAVHATLRAAGRLARLTVAVVRDVLLAATVGTASFLTFTAVLGAVFWSR
jgi:hypothetical protein